MITEIVRLAILIQSVKTWNFDHLNSNETYRLKHVTLYYLRAFLCVEGSTEVGPTLIESNWPENFFALAPKIFPHSSVHSYTKGNNDCQLIHKAKLTHIDSLHRLWLLDSGNAVCKAKIITYDLIRNNEEAFRNDVQLLESDIILTMQLGPTNICSESAESAFFVLFDKPYIISFDPLMNVWQKVYIANSAHDIIGPSTPVYPYDITFDTNKRIFVADSSGKLFSGVLKCNETSLYTDLLGDLIGSPKSMIINSQGTLFYLVPKFGAIIRCLPQKQLSAESSDIIALSPLLINQLFLGIHGSVWIACETPISNYDHCHKLVNGSDLMIKL